MRWVIGLLAIGGLALGACSQECACPAPLPTVGDVVLDVRGTGEAETDVFNAQGRVQVCWEVSGVSLTGGKPDATLIFVSDDTHENTTNVTAAAPDGCSFANIKARRYYVRVSAFPRVEWRIIVKAA